jgi:hypothetical protein
MRAERATDAVASLAIREEAMQQHFSRRDVFWQRWDEPGVEHVQVHEAPDAVTAHGTFIGVADRHLLDLHYTIYTDSAYVFTALELQLTYPDRQILHLSRTQDVGWESGLTVDRAALADCVEIDLSISPFTNTLPIRRLALAVGETAELTVAYIALPSLHVRPERQRYSLLRREGDDSIYRFEHLATEYSVEITVDAAGLVLNYPGLFRRVEA